MECFGLFPLFHSLDSAFLLGVSQFHTHTEVSGCVRERSICGIISIPVFTPHPHQPGGTFGVSMGQSAEHKD